MINATTQMGTAIATARDLPFHFGGVVSKGVSETTVNHTYLKSKGEAQVNAFNGKEWEGVTL